MPMATPADASRAANEVVLTPSAPTTETSNNTLSRMLTRLFRKVWMLTSTFRRESIFSISLCISEMRNLPTT